MNNLYPKETIEDVAILLKFASPEYVEKDCYLTSAILALNTIKDDNFNLIFAGGTCLAKAYRIISRMSEDIDFKIIHIDPSAAKNKSAERKMLSHFRQKIIDTLRGFDFIVEPDRVRSRDNSHYTNITLDYPTYFQNKTSLKPFIMLEFTLADLRSKAIELPIQSFVDDVLHGNPSDNSKLVSCVSLIETAAEKWVGLTRRIASIARNHDHLDETLVRHIYDLHVLIEKIELTKEFMIMVEQTIERDRSKFKRHPEYTTHPIHEIHYALSVLTDDIAWSKYYDKFVNAMVFGGNTIDFKHGLANLINMSGEILANISHN